MIITTCTRTQNSIKRLIIGIDHIKKQLYPRGYILQFIFDVDILKVVLSDMRVYGDSKIIQQFNFI
jgi:hypothetical protein